ncbi:plasmid mobilization protein [Algoriphagus vanfongensis]|uniref:plasmid mobilization protein n=1 Tax=Algoriphagus vanfongensis TaxID=426371 RepID=UPI000478E943|nr:hypothetical protein [Algoriphagus vanfongensis]
MVKIDENTRDKWLHIRLTDQELLTIKANFQKSIYENLSEFARRMLLQKPIVGRYRDTGVQELLKELVSLKRDLHGLATNYNQLAKKMNTASDLEINTHRNQVIGMEVKIAKSLDSVRRFIDQTTAKWLQ